MAVTATTPVGRKRVLGVEPDPVTRALVALYLEPHGYQVQLAASVAEALAELPVGDAAVFLCSEAGLEAASEAERDQLLQAAGPLPVVALLEPGVPAAFTREWQNVKERLIKPLSAVTLLALLQGRAFRSGGMSPPAPEPGNSDEGLMAGFERLMEETEMDSGLARDLALSFLERAPRYLSEIGEAVSGGDLERADRAAHAMKGMCGNLRFSPLVAAAERLRVAARRGDAEAAAQELAGLASDYEALQAVMRARWNARA